ncbi:NAD(P)-dependent oxidoreductase [Microbispora sp. NPDC049125]|uniref:NAD(P)-dependent oxidoreductase n=1 Tax=Microbispora sp. NPDC049125 TaxID=3154929 RepID=UPI0034662E56
MKITIFGATGRMGHLLVQRALDAGHEITAYARDPGKMRITHPALSVISGHLDDDAGILGAVRDAEAVIEGVGAVSDATRRIIAAMDEVRGRRLVVVSTCSVPDPEDLPDAKFAALVRFVKTVAPTPYREVRRAAELVRTSGLDWTLVRVAKLNDGPATGHVKVGAYGHGVVGLSITRADMAAFLLDQVSDTTYLRQAPAISN